MRAKVDALRRALVWEKFGDATKSLSEVEDKEVVEALMTRDDVVEFIKSVTKGIPDNNAFASIATCRLPRIIQ